VSAPVAILISGRGSNMVALVEAMSRAGAAARPVLVVSNDPEAAGLARAAALGVATEALDHRAFADRAAFDRALGERLAAAGAEIVACAGFMRILGPAMTGPWAGRILNIHPSLLPLFPCLDTHARALAAGVAVHGATVHEVTEALDAGPILGQAAVAVRGGDTADALGARVRAAEHALYPAVLDAFARDRAALRRAPLAQLRPDL
jgi:phosphoribosylglycinamide formyltransferase-1